MPLIIRATGEEACCCQSTGMPTINNCKPWVKAMLNIIRRKASVSRTREMEDTYSSSTAGHCFCERAHGSKPNLNSFQPHLLSGGSTAVGQMWACALPIWRHPSKQPHGRARPSGQATPPAAIKAVKERHTRTVAHKQTGPAAEHFPGCTPEEQSHQNAPSAKRIRPQTWYPPRRTLRASLQTTTRAGHLGVNAPSHL